MSKMLERIKELAVRREIHISEHGYDELADDGILVRDIVSGLSNAEMLEDYPKYHKGPSVWGIAKGKHSPAVLVTAYRPDKSRWSSDFRRRIK